MNFLQFMFSGFWTFLGCMMLIGAASRFIIALVAIAVRGRR